MNEIASAYSLALYKAMQMVQDIYVLDEAWIYILHNTYSK